MKPAVVLLVCFLTGHAFSQEDVRPWINSRLTKADFTGNAFPAMPFQIKYDIACFRKKEKIGRTKHVHFGTEARMIPSQSWITDDSLLPLRLRYGNLILDFVELYSRKLQDQVNVSLDTLGARARTLREVDDIVATISYETAFGTKEERLSYWEAYIDSTLQATFRKDVPDFRYDRMTLGYAAGASYLHLTQNLGAKFSSPAMFSFVFYLSWKRVVYGGQLGFPGSSKPSGPYQSEKYEFGDTARFNISYQHFYVGYEIVKKTRFTMAPFAGITTMRLIRKDVPEEDPAYLGPLKASWNLGIMADWRSQPFFQNNKILLRYGVNFRTSVSRYEYLPTLNGYALSFNLGVSLYLDAIRNYL